MLGKPILLCQGFPIFPAPFPAGKRLAATPAVSSSNEPGCAPAVIHNNLRASADRGKNINLHKIRAEFNNKRCA
jgi:hypothetical protein